ncbi:MAG TPA: hypothetical protein VGM83_01550 [Devosiaceae bacterium]|jgi:hypothetical protein
MPISTTLKPLGPLFALSATLAAGPAMAQDAQDLANKLQAVYATAGYDIVLGAGTVSGDSISYDGLTVAIKALGVAEPLKIGTKLTFNGVKEQADGSYDAEEMVIPDMNVDVDTVSVEIKDMVFKGVHISGAATPTVDDLIQAFTSFNSGPITANENGQTVVEVASLSGTNDFERGADGKVTSVTAEAQLDGLKAPLPAIPDPQAKAFVDALQLTSVSGKAHESMHWNFADGNMNIDDLSLTLDDLGSIAMSFNITGYTTQFLQETNEAQARIIDLEAKGDTEGVTGEQNQMAAKMMSNLSLVSASVRYDDDSAVGKILDYLGKQQNITGEQMASGLKMVVPAMLAQSGLQSISADVSAAVSNFLDDPQSLQVSVEPAAPLAFGAIAGAAAQPDTLASTLGLQVVANEAN